jgi:hypothetical protein
MARYIFDTPGWAWYNGGNKSNERRIIMRDKLTKVIKSGGAEYDVTVTCNGMTPEQAQEDALNYYIWKLQRVLRAATDKQRAEWAANGIVVHYTEVGKRIESVEQTVDKLSDEQARAAFELLKAKLGKK